MFCNNGNNGIFKTKRKIWIRNKAPKLKLNQLFPALQVNDVHCRSESTMDALISKFVWSSLAKDIKIFSTIAHSIPPPQLEIVLFVHSVVELVVQNVVKSCHSNFSILGAFEALRNTFLFRKGS